MILGDPLLAALETAPGQGRITLDDLFRRVASRQPSAIAIADPPNRDAFTDRPPVRLTYAEADRVISAIAGRLRRMGLTTDSIVGIQMPNIAENVLTLLGVMRAGLIAAPLPLLWRRADVVTALARLNAKALITMNRVGDFRHCQFATRVAAEVFSIRYVCGFGRDLPDGVVPLDDLFVVRPDPVPPLERDANAAAHLAIITFEVGEDGPLPVARRHLEFLTGGLDVLLEAGIEQDTAVLSAIAPVSFGGICLTLVPWLLTGGTLVLHHPFTFDIFARQRRDHRCRTLILPAPVAYRLAESGLFTHEGPTTVVAAWYAPDLLADSADWPERDAVLVDVSIFGEAGLIAARRGAGARPAPLPLGAVVAPREGENAVSIAELTASGNGTVALRGPMVPRHAFPPNIERSDQPHFVIGRDGYVDTGYPCDVDVVSKTVIVTGPPAGIVNVGGYRFPLCALLQTVGRIDPGAALSSSSDPLTGQRLVGSAADPDAMQAALSYMGVNPLVTAAFAGRGERILREAGAA